MASKNTVLMLSWAILVVTLLVLVVSLNKYGITGFATDDATANLTINTYASVAFYEDSCNFSSGEVTEVPEIPFDYAYVYTNGTSTINGTWDASGGCANGLIVTNDGNVRVEMNLSSDAAAADFIGGSTPGFKAIVTTTSCDGTEGLNSLTEIAGSGTHQTICSNMTLGANATIHFELKIPEDALPGDSGALLTAHGTAI